MLKWFLLSLEDASGIKVIFNIILDGIWQFGDAVCENAPENNLYLLRLLPSNDKMNPKNNLKKKKKKHFKGAEQIAEEEMHSSSNEPIYFGAMKNFSAHVLSASVLR